MSQVKVSAAQSNKAIFGLIEQGQVKEAADMVTDFTRIRIRESSIFEKVLPGVKIADDELTPQLDTDKNIKLVEAEPGSPGACTIPLGSLPIQYYIRGHRYAVFFDRMVTPRFQKDTSELRTYGMDIRQVISDNAILDMDEEFDRKMLAAVDNIVGAEGSTVSETGVIQNRKIVDALGITRRALTQLRKILPSIYTRLDAVTILCNNLVIHDISSFGRDEVGGDLSEQMFVEGFQQKRLIGVNWIVTNKQDLVPSSSVLTDDATFYIFASPEFMGKSFILEDVTMWLDKQAFLITWFAYCERGATIQNIGSVAKARIATA